MENTDRILFGDDTEEWFVAMGARWTGPVSASNLYDRVKEGQIGWGHYVWKFGMSDWLRLSHVREFSPALPEKPSPHLLMEVEESWNSKTRAGQPPGTPPPPPSGDDPNERVWFLHYNEAQFGPFSAHEIERYLEAGKIHGKVFVWKDGFANWKRLNEVEALAKYLGQVPTPPPPGAGMTKPMAAPPREERTDQRHAPRRPMVAKVLVSNEKDIAIGMCRDISVGGMQILADSIPGEVGESVRLNVSPSEGEKSEDFEAFAAEAVIVRHLEDGRGFSVRFHELDAGAQASIMSYVGH